MTYKTVVADPPWTPILGATWKTRFTDKARPQKQYSTLSVGEICKMKPPTEKQAHLLHRTIASSAIQTEPTLQADHI